MGGNRGGGPPGSKLAWVVAVFPFHPVPGRPNKSYQGLSESPVKVTLTLPDTVSAV